MTTAPLDTLTHNLLNTDLKHRHTHFIIMTSSVPKHNTHKKSLCPQRAKLFNTLEWQATLVYT